LEGTAQYVEALGRETFVGVTVPIDASFTLRIDGAAHIEIGDTVRFGLTPGELHLFDPATEQLIGRG
jgi:hypothetical protein